MYFIFYALYNCLFNFWHFYFKVSAVLLPLLLSLKIEIFFKQVNQTFNDGTEKCLLKIQIEQE